MGFSRKNISYCKTNEDSLNLETTLLNDSFIYDNPLCLNQTKNIPDASGTIFLNDSSAICKLLNEGWFFGFVRES